MKATNHLFTRIFFFAVILGLCEIGRTQTATWIGASGGEWNTAANWDIGVPGVGTNAVIPAAAAVNYNNPMTTASFRTLSLSNTLAINTTGFVIDEANASSTTMVVATNATLNIAANAGVTITNSAGSITVPNGGTITVGNNALLLVTNSSGSGGFNLGNSGNFSKGGNLTINSGGTATMDKQLSVAGVSSKAYVNGGTLNCLAGSRVSESQNDGGARIAVASGAANLGNFSVSRSDVTGGLLVTNGAVNATAISIGTGNSTAYSTIVGGALTNTGAFNISDTTLITDNSSDRKSYFLVRGGTVVSTDSGGIVIASQSNLSTTPSAGGTRLGGVLDVGSGTVIAEKITLIRDNTITNAYASFVMSGGTVYLGSGGLVFNNGFAHIGRNLAFTGGTLGAKASWSSSAPLSIANTVTFKAADLANTPFNITLTGAITNTGSLTKTGGGVLTLSGNNTYGGNTTISAGSLVLANANALPKGTALTLGSSGNAATLDLAGFNVQISNLALGSGATAANQLITNGSVANTSILTFSNPAANATFGGGVMGSKPIALTLLGGNLVLSGQNNSYGGNLFISNGKLTLSGAGSMFGGSTIVLSNSAAALDISGMGGTTLGAGQSLSGYGIISGNVTAANCPVSPGAVGTVGTLSFSNNLTLNGGVTNHFDLALDPNSTGNDLIVVVGALNVSGLNTIDVSPVGASLSAGTYKLIAFGSLGSGSAANFQVTGTLGASLQSAISVTSTEVDLVVSPVGGTQRVWVGDGSANNWDYTTTNWLNGATPDVFNDGNFAVFDDTGTGTPPINLTTTLQPAAVLVNATANYTFSGVGKISGSGTLAKTNSGALTILTTNNYSGVTTINSGILQLGNGTTSGSFGTNIIQNSGGALVLDLPGSNTFSNVINGAGSLVQAGSGTLTLTASNSYSGGTTISNGTLQLNTGAWFGGGNVTNNGVLVFNSSGNSTVNAVISGTGTVTLANTGTVTLAGNNIYSGGTAINHGVLLVNNSTGSGVGTGAVMVASGGTLSGNGVIGSAVTINSGGIFAPGNPTGTLTVSNDFTASSGAILNYTLGTSSDKTVVSGNLNLNGTLNITAGSGLTSATYTLFTYGGALNLGTLTLALPANTSGTIDTNTPGLVNLTVSTLQTNILAFPGALGFGANATGARIGGSVYHVTTLADSGTGSFRDAVSHSGRFVVFDVGGTITLNSVVSCSSGLTIAGQTAPGEGIAIIGHEVSFSAKQNEIVRYLRIRPYSASDGEDGINVGDGTNMIFDHISLEISPYNNIDAHGNNGSDAITVQNSIIADPASNGTSHKQGFGAHTEHVGGKMAWYYNLWVSEHNRQPLAKIDTIFVNNTEYNFQAGYTVASTSGKFRHDIINNYFITGPADTGGSDAFFQMNANQTIYSTGNLRDNNNDGTLNGSSISPGGGGPVLSAPWSPLSTNCTVFSTASAARYDISWAGTMPHDQLDDLVVSQVKTLGHGIVGTTNGTAGPDGNLYNNEGQTGLGNGGFGIVTGGVTPLDSDQDGMPDYWEQALGSNPNVADSLTPGTGGYTKLENYLNWLATPHAVASKNSFVDVDLRQYTGGFTNVSPVYAAFAPTSGTVALLADGHTAEFTPAGNFFGLGSFNFSVHGSDGTVMTNTVAVLVAATSLSQNLTWHGDGTANNWDDLTTSNWLNGANVAAFNTNDDVTFDDTGSDIPAINLVGVLQPASVTVAADQNYIFGGSGSLVGPMVLAKSGAGVLTIGTSNTFSGGTFVDGGTLTMGNAAANASGLGTNTVTLNNGTRLNLFDAGMSTDAGTLPNNLVVSGSTTLELPERGGAGGATFTGSGNFNLINHYVRGNFNYDCSAFTGTFTALTPDGSADFRMGTYAGFANAVVNLSNNINAYFTATISPAGNTVDFGQINAPASATLRGGPTSGRAVTLRIGALGTDSSFAGSIAEQTIGSTTSLVKIGAGTLTLGGANSYSGQTVVSNGTLVVNGSTGTNSLIVVNGILGGNGAIRNGATLYSGNAISPGADINPGTVGTLTITNGLALTNVTLYFDLASVTTAGGGANDLISLSGGTLTLGGVTTVTPNLLNGFLSAGSYTLISGGNSTIGSAANLAWAGATGTRQAFSFDTTTTPGSVFLNVAGSPPATLVWSGTNGSAWNLNSTVNWLNGGAADKFFSLDAVIFNDASTNGSVTISGVVQPSQVTVTNSILNYSLGGGVLGGVGQLVKGGSGTLTLGGSNSFSGGTFINGGTIVLSNDTANQFGLGAGSVTLNGGALTMHDDASTSNSSSWNLIVPINSTGTLNADSRCDLQGSLSGGGALNFHVPSTNTILDGDWSAFTGNINVTSSTSVGDFRVNNFAGYPNAMVSLGSKVNAYFSGAVDPDGTTLQIGELSGVSSSTLLGGATAGNIFTWQVGGQNTDAIFAGTIAEQNTNAITALEKIGTGTWTLSGSNSFSGGLSVNDGTLQINNTNGSATGTNQVFVATGATLSGNGIISGLTAFDDGAILAPGNPSGTLTISNELDLSDLTMLQFGLGTNSDKVIVSGNLAFGGQLNLTDIGGFGTGTYTLFTYGGTLTVGNPVIATAPAGFIYAISTSTPGQINLVVTRLQFDTVNPGNAGLVMSGSGGPANGNYYVLGSTNLAASLNLWTRIMTNQFDAGGNFSFTNAINPNAPQQFFLLQLP